MITRVAVDLSMLESIAHSHSVTLIGADLIPQGWSSSIHDACTLWPLNFDLIVMSSSEIVLNSSSSATQVNFVEGRWTSDAIDI